MHIFSLQIPSYLLAYTLNSFLVLWPVGGGDPGWVKGNRAAICHQPSMATEKLQRESTSKIPVVAAPLHRSGAHALGQMSAGGLK